MTCVNSWTSSNHNNLDVFDNVNRYLVFNLAMDRRKIKVSKKGKEVAKKKTLRQTNKKNVKNNRVCGSGKPMPSYKELKAIYENADEEVEPEVSSSETGRETQVTPVKVENSIVNGEEMVSPRTLKFIAARALEYLRTTKLVPSVMTIDNTRKDLTVDLSNCVGDHTEHINEIITNRRHKKKVIILGNDDESPELPEICLGDEFSFSNSGGNNDIEAADSDSTVNYDIDEFMNAKTVKEVIKTSPEQSFSPIPSTSRNEKIFEQNDIIYEKCILQNKGNVSHALKEVNTNVKEVRTPSPADRMEIEPLAVDSQLPDSSQEAENKLQAFDKLLEQIELEESDHDDVVVVNVEDVIQENNALFKKFKSENNLKPELPPLTNISSTENENLKPPFNVTPKEEIIINDNDEENRTKKREEEMSLIVTNYFKQQTPIVINDSRDDESDHQCTSTSGDSNLLDTIVKYIASTQLVKKTKALVHQALDTNVNKTIHRKRVNRIAGSCQIVDFVNLDNYASPVNASKVFDDEIIILDDSDAGTSFSNDNYKNENVPSTSTDTENSPSTSQGVCQTSTPLIETHGKRRNRKRKSNQTNLNITVEDTPKKARVEDISLNETEVTPRRNIGDCPICLEALTSKPISSTVCGHIFCLTCMQTIMKTSKRCPTCRKVLRGAKAYHPIFL